MAALKILLYVFSLLSILTVLLPFIKNDHWIFRIFDYPRLQKFALTGITAACWFAFFREGMSHHEYVLTGILGTSFFYLGYLIVPFTPFGKKMIKNTRGEYKPLNLLVSNVYQDNKEFDRLLALVKKKNPDIIFLVETDQKWLQGVGHLRKEYPHHIEVPRDNTYGLLFYSRLPILKYDVKYLVDKEIPSVIADVEFSGKAIRIYGLHPTPPVPQENESSTDRDAEILLIGKMAKEHDGPCLVIGDLNDVAWSYTTKLFLKTSGLLDPRRGRGLYSTFHAKYPLLRWPLDHFFVSTHFRLRKINVEDNIGSDHFPISISLVLSDEDNNKQLHADSEDKRLADKKIEKGFSN
ncbi:MAG TPA: endonuclease/exonuclease/phosphatase family protein [Flavobacterium sp.]|jgi:endonuclease/exonuclease/phosphatase (EEP) superfamily protein YafD